MPVQMRPRGDVCGRPPDQGPAARLFYRPRVGGLAVVTGTSRGFGRACTEELAAAGWAVVALVRTTEDADSWRSRPGVAEPVKASET